MSALQGRRVACPACHGDGMVEASGCYWRRCVPCKGSGTISIDLPSAEAGIPSPSSAVSLPQRGGEKDLKRKRTLLAVVGLLLSCSAERGAKMVNGLDGGLDEGVDDGAAPIRGAHDAPGVDVMRVEASVEVSPAVVVDVAPFEALWELPICGDLNNPTWIVKWPGQDCTEGDAGGAGMIRLPTRGNKLLSCWAGKPVNVPLPCYMPATMTDGSMGVIEHIRVNDCRECIQ
jgi:hypothetical protein